MCLCFFFGGGGSQWCPFMTKVGGMGRKKVYEDVIFEQTHMKSHKFKGYFMYRNEVKTEWKKVFTGNSKTQNGG